MDNIPVEKDEENERPIPTDWRSVLKKMADCLIDGDFQFSNAPKNVLRLDERTATINRDNIDDYPDALGPLAETTWQTSIYIRDGNFWRVLLDLSDENGKTTDLTLHAKVRKIAGRYEFEPYLVYVP